MLRVAGWERFDWLRAGFSTREGGRSVVYASGVAGEGSGEFGEMNLGWTKEDDPAVVAANRAAFVDELAAGAPMRLLTVRQVHSGLVRRTEEEPEPLMTDDGKATREGDGLVSRTAGQMLAVLTADCVPVLVADVRGRAVGAFHAGWRGTLAGVVGEGLARMRAAYGTLPENVVAAIGPSIRACCFEVGEDVREAFAMSDPAADSLFVPAGTAGKLRMDLVEANRRQLVAAGVPAEAICAVGECTACARSADGRRSYFSYRAEGGMTGRMLSGIGVVG